MKRFKVVAFLLCAVLSCNLATVYAAQAKVVKNKPVQIKVKDMDKNTGADSYNNAGDNPNSRYYINPDFYNAVSDKNLTIIGKFETMQQTAEWSCGDAMALMVLNHFGVKFDDEMVLAEGMGSHVDADVKGAKPGSANNFPEYGTNVEQLYKYFKTLKDVKVVETSYKEKYTKSDLLTKEDGVSENKIGNLKPTFFANSLYTSENKKDSEAYVSDAKDSYFVKWLVGNLKNNRPIMVEWGDWDGHWQAIIGYDNNNTPSIGDDILIFADPYDTSDHWQDGYYYYPLERWFYMWGDLNVAKKPLQIQPYIIIDKNTVKADATKVDATKTAAKNVKK